MARNPYDIRAYTEDGRLDPAYLGESTSIRALQRGAANLQSNAGSVRNALLALGVGDDPEKDAQLRELEAQQAERVQRAQEENPYDFADFESAKTPLDKVGFLYERAVESAPYLGAALAGGALGGVPGAFFTTAALEGGNTYQNTLEKTGERHPYLSLGAGAAKSAIDTLSLRSGIRSILSPSGVAETAARTAPASGAAAQTAAGVIRNPRVGLARVGEETAKGVFREAPTESLQEGIDVLAERQAAGQDLTGPLSAEEFNRLLEAGAVGGFAGGMTAGGARAGIEGVNKAFTRYNGAPEGVRIVDSLIDQLKANGGMDILKSQGFSEDDIRRNIFNQRTTSQYGEGDSAYNDVAGDQAFWDVVSTTGLQKPIEVVNRAGNPWASPELTQEAGFEFGNDVLAQQLNKLEQTDPFLAQTRAEMERQGASPEEIDSYIRDISPYRRVDYTQILKNRATSEDKPYEALVKEEAQRLRESYPRLAQVSEGKSDEEFLKQFEGIIRNPLAYENAPDTNLAFTVDEITGRGDDSKAILRKPFTSKGGQAKRQIRQGERPVTIETRNGTKTERALNLHALVSNAMRKTGFIQNPSVREVQQAFFDGLASLLTNPHAGNINLDQVLDPKGAEKTVVFTAKTSDGKRVQYTLKDMLESATGRLFRQQAHTQEQMAALVEEQNRIKEQLDRLDKIPDEMVDAKTVEQAKALEKEFFRIYRRADALRKIQQNIQTRIEKEIGTKPAPEERLLAAEDFLELLQEDLNNAPYLEQDREFARTFRRAKNDVEFWRGVVAENEAEQQHREGNIDNPAAVDERGEQLRREFENRNQDQTATTYNVGPESLATQQALRAFRAAVAAYDRALESGQVMDIAVAGMKASGAAARVAGLLRLPSAQEQDFRDAYKTIFGEDLPAVFDRGAVREALKTFEDNAYRRTSDTFSDLSSTQKVIAMKSARWYSPTDPIWENKNDEAELDWLMQVLGTKPITPELESHIRQIKEQTRAVLERVGLQDFIEVVSDVDLQTRPEFQEVDVRDSHGMFFRPPGSDKFYIYISSKPASKDFLSHTIPHEVGHAVHYFLLQKAPKDVADAILDEYNAFRDEVDEGASSAQRFLRAVRERRFSLADTLRVGLDVELATDASLEVHIMEIAKFHEWFADRISQRLADPKPPRTRAERFFATVVDKLGKIFGTTKHSDTIYDYVDSLMRAPTKNTSTAVNAIIVSAERMAAGGHPFDAPSAARSEGVSENFEIPNGVQRSVKAIFQRLTGREPDAATMADVLQLAISEANYDILGAAHHLAFKRAAKTLLRTEELAALRKEFNRPAMKLKLARIFKQRAPELWSRAEEDFDTMMALGYQAWVGGLIDIRPRPRTIFQKIRNFLMEVFGILQNSEIADQLLNAVTEGRALDRHSGGDNFMVQAVSRETRLQRLTHDTLLPAWEKVWKNDLWRGILSAGGARVRSFNNTALTKIANMVSVGVGTAFEKEDMLTARRKIKARYDNVFRNMFEDKTPEFAQSVLRELQLGTTYPDGPQGEVQQYVVKIRHILRGLYRYGLEAGLDIGDRGENYFPWVFDPEYIQNNQQRLVSLLEANPEVVRRLQEYYQLSPEQFVYALANDNMGYQDDEHLDPNRKDHVPKFSSMNKREFGWLQQALTPDQWAQFSQAFSQDLGHTLRVYFEQMANRAEWFRRFGGGKLDKMLLEAKREGASDKEVEVTRKLVNAAMGMSGLDTNEHLIELLNKIPGVSLEPPAPGEVINPKLKSVMNVAIVYQNLRTLGLATITSLADPLGIAVRTGDLRVAAQGFKAGLTSLYRQATEQPDQLESLAELLGIVDRRMTVEALNWEYGGAFTEGTTARINEGFFKFIGLEAWTRATRVMALESAIQSMTYHSAHISEFGDRMLAELGVAPGDLLVRDEQGRVKVYSNQDRYQIRRIADMEPGTETLDLDTLPEGLRLMIENDPEAFNTGAEIDPESGEGTPIVVVDDTLVAAAQQDLERDDRVRTAVTRFVDQSILRPEASLRPIWASDPHFMLLFHLKSFTYAFHERILKRVLWEAANGNFASMWMFFLFIPAMIGADALRDLIQHGTDGDPQKTSWGVTDYTFNAMQRAGMLGLGQIPLDAMNAEQHGDASIEGLLGPTYDQFDDILTDEDYDLIEALPGQNIIKYWLEQ